MSTTLEAAPPNGTVTTGMVVYSVSDAAIAELRQEFTGLTADTPHGYEQVRQAIATTRGLRGDIERCRVDLKSEALAYGRRVDSEANRLTDLLLQIETPLKTAKDAIDHAKELARRDAEEQRLAAERAELDSQRAAVRAQQDALRAQQDALRTQQLAAEAAQHEARQKIEAERRRIEAEQQAERGRIEAERRAVDAERQRIDRIEFDRQARELAEQEARERAERDRVDAERRAVLAAAWAEAEANRCEAMRPDVEKIHAVAGPIRAIVLPEVCSDAARKFLAGVARDLEGIAEWCEGFKP